MLTWLACTLLVGARHGRRRALVFFLVAPFVSLGAAFTWSLLLQPRRPREGAEA